MIVDLERRFGLLTVSDSGHYPMKRPRIKHVRNDREQPECRHIDIRLSHSREQFANYSFTQPNIHTYKHTLFSDSDPIPPLLLNRKTLVLMLTRSLLDIPTYSILLHASFFLFFT